MRELPIPPLSTTAYTTNSKQKKTNEEKQETIRPSCSAGRGFGGRLEHSGERPGSCTCSNFQAKSTLFPILPTAALKKITNLETHFMPTFGTSLFLVHDAADTFGPNQKSIEATYTAQSSSNISLAAVVTAIAVWAHIGQNQVQVLCVFAVCESMNSSLYAREVEVSTSLMYDMVLGRVWSQTFTPETLTARGAYWLCSSMKSLQPVHRSTTVCHTPVACSQCHPLTQPPSHMYGRVTGRGQPSAGWLRGFCPHSHYGDYSTEYWGSQYTMKPLFSKYNQHTVYLDMCAHSYKHSHQVSLQWLSETNCITVLHLRYTVYGWYIHWNNECSFIHLLFFVVFCNNHG